MGGVGKLLKGRWAKWRDELPELRFVLIALLLVALGRLYMVAGGAAVIERFADQLVRDLAMIQPGAVLEAFDAAMRRTVLMDGSAASGDPRMTLASAWLTTVGDIWGGTGWPGRVILIGAMVSAFMLCWAAFRRWVGLGFWEVPVALLVSVFVAGAFAFALQWVAIWLFWGLGRAMGAWLFLVGSVGWVWGVWQLFGTITGWGKAMEHAVPVVGAVVGVASLAEPGKAEPGKGPDAGPNEGP